MSFASGLKQAMLEKEISQTELANRIGKGKSSVSQYLSGKNVPKPNVQKRIAEILDCTVEWLNSEVSESETTELKNISIAQAAKVLGKSEQFLRVALQRGTVSFGFAVRNKTKWSYHISPKKFAEYIDV